jgi:hypothetical protein
MITKLSSIKLAIDALNRRVDVLDELIGTTPITEKNDKKVLQYAEDLENCRIAIEDMKRLKEEREFEAAMDKFLYVNEQPDDLTNVVLDE